MCTIASICSRLRYIYTCRVYKISYFCLLQDTTIVRQDIISSSTTYISQRQLFTVCFLLPMKDNIYTALLPHNIHCTCAFISTLCTHARYILNPLVKAGHPGSAITLFPLIYVHACMNFHVNCMSKINPTTEVQW